MSLRFRDSTPLLNPKGKPWSEQEFKDHLADFSIDPYIKAATEARIQADPEYKKITEEYHSVNKSIQDKQSEVSTLLNAAQTPESIKAFSKARDELDALIDSERTIRATMINSRKIATAESIMETFVAKGYTHIPYTNASEDKGSVSFIVLNPKKNLRLRNAKFQKEYGDLMSGFTGAAVVGAGAAGADTKEKQ